MKSSRRGNWSRRIEVLSGKERGQEDEQANVSSIISKLRARQILRSVSSSSICLQPRLPNCMVLSRVITTGSPKDVNKSIDVPAEVSENGVVGVADVQQITDSA